MGITTDTNTSHSDKYLSINGNAITTTALHFENVYETPDGLDTRKYAIRIL